MLEVIEYNRVKRSQLASWNALEQHASIFPKSIQKKTHSINLKINSVEFEHITQNMCSNTLPLLLKLAAECQLKDHIKLLLTGGIVNESQGLPALHTALRGFKAPEQLDHDIYCDIESTLQQLQTISEQIRNGQWLGYSQKPIKCIVNVGIGGSDFGPKLCINALNEFTEKGLEYRFISDVCSNAFERAVNDLNPETTLFIISSKSFTTYETLYNARKAFKWIGEHNTSKHFIAVTAYPERAKELGIKTILPIWGWVGGRYSFCSAINLIGCIALGYEHFLELLEGARVVDEHFYQRELHENLPVIMGLVGIWNINFLKIPSLLMLIYASQLELLVPYIQQLDMESNGKSFDKYGSSINYSTGPIVWGGSGNQAQHSYYQLLSQGTHKIAADLITIKSNDSEIINDFCNAKIKVLNDGIVAGDRHSYISGGMPMNHIKLEACTPFNLGALIALYEHKIFVQSVIWNINPFDQPGVESAKTFAGSAAGSKNYREV